MRTAVACGLVVGCLAGCATAPVGGGPRGDNLVAPAVPVTEKVLEEIPGPRPGWIDRTPEATAQSLYFAGASGYQTQERDARNDALRDAVNAFARYCGVDVSLVDEYLAVSVAKASGVTDPTITQRVQGTQATEAFVSRVKGQEWYARRIERSMGATVLERGWQAWVLVTVPPDEVARVQAYQEKRRSEAAEARAAPVLEPYARAVGLLGSARKARDEGGALEALGAYLDALELYEKAAAHPEFPAARPVLTARGYEYPLTIEAEVQALLAGLALRADPPVSRVEPGETPSGPLRARVSAGGAPLAGVTVAFTGDATSVTATTGPDGAASFTPDGVASWPEGTRSFQAGLRHAALERASGRFGVPGPVSLLVEVRALPDSEAGVWNREALARLAGRLAAGPAGQPAQGRRRVVVLPPLEPGGLTALGTLLAEGLEASLAARSEFQVLAVRDVTGAGGAGLGASSVLSCRAAPAAERIYLACRLVDAETAALAAAGEEELRFTTPLRQAAGRGVAGAHGVELEAEFVYERSGGGTARILEGSSLPSGTRYRLAFEPGQAAHVYAYQVDSAGRVFPFFPNPEFSPARNPVGAGQKLRLPDGGWAFELDETPGAEELVVVASRVALPAVDRVFEALRAGMQLRTEAAPGGELVARAAPERRTLHVIADRETFDQAIELLANPALGTVRKVRFVHR